MSTDQSHYECLRRAATCCCARGMGFGSLALAQLLGGERIARSGARPATRWARWPARRALSRRKAKRVIHLFMNGGPSHVDTFDPKPALTKLRRQGAADRICQTERKTGAAFASPFKFQKVRPERHRGERAVFARRPSASTTSA